MSFVIEQNKKEKTVSTTITNVKKALFLSVKESIILSLCIKNVILNIS
jgi:hypothetical protein